MPGICLDGRTYEMRRNGNPFLARGGDDGVGLTKVVRFEDGNGSDFCVPEEWFKNHKEPARIKVNTSKIPTEIILLG